MAKKSKFDQLADLSLEYMNNIARMAKSTLVRRRTNVLIEEFKAKVAKIKDVDK